MYRLCIAILSGILSSSSLASEPKLFEPVPTSTAETTPALLVDDFVAALEHFLAGTDKSTMAASQKLWVEAFAARGIQKAYVDKRLRKAKLGRYKIGGTDPLAAYRLLKVETFASLPSDKAIDAAALHAFRIDVVEDYDDVFNDNIYCYFITTHDDLVWGKVSSIYEGLDEGESFFLSPEDRGIFGPQGEKLTPRNHLIVDVGIVESDGEDIAQLQKISDAIVDLALVALTLYDPNAGAAAAQARAETTNLLNLLIGMDTDDRMVTDTIHMTPDSLNDLMAEHGGDAASFAEFNRDYERETFWTHFAYRMHFRLIR